MSNIQKKSMNYTPLLLSITKLMSVTKYSRQILHSSTTSSTDMCSFLFIGLKSQDNSHFLITGVKQIPEATNRSHVWPAQIAAQTQTKICLSDIQTKCLWMGGSISEEKRNKFGENCM